MQKNLVIVESPAKAKTIGKFLGKDYKVLSSYGHIRDLKKKEFSIDTTDFTPEYEIPSDKREVVKELKEQADKAETVWLASDEDREGEAISWHLSEVLQLTPERTRRIVFHEITKQAILDAIEHPRDIDVNLVNAQQARRVLDRIVGFKLSPVLWKKVRPSLSAGRVQSVAVRLIAEREHEIKQFKSEAAYRVTGVFQLAGKEANDVMKAELSVRFSAAEEAEAFLKACRNARFTVKDLTVRPLKRMPSAPFTTSTLQQEAAHRLGFTVSQTMMVAQRLYESGRITYMRTDSVNLSSLCINACKKVIETMMGAEYLKSRQYHTKTKGAQEAHEAIRPTYMDVTKIEGTAQERRLYDLIWKRTVASQMSDAELEKTTVTIEVSGQEPAFVATGEVVKFDGFLRVYRENRDEERDALAPESGMLPAVGVGDELNYVMIQAAERFSQHAPRYNEATLVKKLEELGIGRPSTYAPTISTIQQRGYVEKGDKKGDEKTARVLTLQSGVLTEETKNVVINAEKNKLLPTDVGMIVNDFLMQYFPDILDYNFTADVEKDFDDIAEGKTEWKKMLEDFYTRFVPELKKALEDKREHKVGERLLGTDPKTGKPVFAKIGRYGSIVQIGSADDAEKPRFAPVKKDMSLESITLDEALELFRLPRKVGTFEGKEVVISIGRFGPYVQHDGKYASLPKEYDPLTASLTDAIKVIVAKRRAEAKRHLRTFPEDENLEVLDGRYGPYIVYEGTNYRIVPKTTPEKAAQLSYSECMEIVKSQQGKPKRARGKSYTSKK